MFYVGNPNVGRSVAVASDGQDKDELMHMVSASHVHLAHEEEVACEAYSLHCYEPYVPMHTLCTKSLEGSKQRQQGERDKVGGWLRFDRKQKRKIAQKCNMASQNSTRLAKGCINYTW